MKLQTASIAPFLFNAYRKRLWKKALAELQKISSVEPVDYGIGPERMVSGIYVFGSFATSKETPTDVDIVVFRKDLPSSEFSHRWEYGVVDIFIESDAIQLQTLKTWLEVARRKYQKPTVIDITGNVYPGQQY